MSFIRSCDRDPSIRRTDHTWDKRKRIEKCSRTKRCQLRVLHLQFSLAVLRLDERTGSIDPHRHILPVLESRGEPDVDRCAFGNLVPPNRVLHRDIAGKCDVEGAPGTSRTLNGSRPVRARNDNARRLSRIDQPNCNPSQWLSASVVDRHAYTNCRRLGEGAAAGQHHRPHNRPYKMLRQQTNSTAPYDALTISQERLSA